MAENEDEKQAARDRLTKLTARYEKAEAQLDQARQEVNDEIVATLMARILGPAEVTRLSPYERQHVGRIAKAAGVPPLREPTVVSAKKAAGGGSRAAAVAPQRVVTARADAAPAPAPRRTATPRPQRREPVEMTDERAAELVALVRERGTARDIEELDRRVTTVGEAYKDFAFLAEAQGMGLLTQAEMDGSEEPSA